MASNGATQPAAAAAGTAVMRPAVPGAAATGPAAAATKAPGQPPAAAAAPTAAATVKAPGQPPVAAAAPTAAATAKAPGQQLQAAPTFAAAAGAPPPQQPAAGQGAPAPQTAAPATAPVVNAAAMQAAAAGPAGAAATPPGGAAAAGAQPAVAKVKAPPPQLAPMPAHLLAAHGPHMIGVGGPLQQPQVAEALDDLVCATCHVVGPQSQQPSAQHTAMALWAHPSIQDELLGHVVTLPELPAEWHGPISLGHMGTNPTPMALRLQWVPVPVPGAPPADAGEVAAAAARAQSAKDRRRQRDFEKRVAASGDQGRLPHQPSTVGGPKTPLGDAPAGWTGPGSTPAAAPSGVRADLAAPRWGDSAAAADTGAAAACPAAQCTAASPAAQPAAALPPPAPLPQPTPAPWMRPAGKAGAAAPASSSAAASSGTPAQQQPPADGGAAAAAAAPAQQQPPTDGGAAAAANAPGARAIALPPASPAGVQPRGTHAAGLRRIRLISTINSREGRALAFDRGAGPVQHWVATGMLQGQAPRWQFANCRGDSGAVMWGVVHHPSVGLVIQAMAQEAAAQMQQRAIGTLPALPDGCDAVVAFHDVPGAHLSPAVAGTLGPVLELRGFRCQVEHLANSFTTNACQCSRHPANQGRWCQQVSRQTGRDPGSRWLPRETAQFLHEEQWGMRAEAIRHLLQVAGPILQAHGL